jgi:long-chain acyl-CoA synthetase
VNDITDDVVQGFTQGRARTFTSPSILSFHIMALGLFMAIGLNKGNTTCAHAGAPGGRHHGAIERYQVRWMLGVPALYRMILDNDRSGSTFKLKSQILLLRRRRAARGNL